MLVNFRRPPLSRLSKAHWGSNISRSRICSPIRVTPVVIQKRRSIQLTRAIRDFGFLIPILIDGCNSIIAGHARLEAAKLLGLAEVPCIRAGHLTEAQKRTFTIVDNRLAEDATWDFQLLAKELEFLQGEGIDLQLSGFAIPEIEMILDAGSQTSSNAKVDSLPELAPTRAVTKPNDLWILGDHGLHCGDARRRDSFKHFSPVTCPN